MFPADYVLEPLVRSPSAYGLVFVLGTLFGSFANVCIYRWPPSEDHPDGRSVVRPGSHCSSCGQPVRWFDNIPLVSYLLLRGRCRDCGVSFSPRYLLVEAVLGLLFVAAYHHSVATVFMYEPVADRLARFLILAAFQFVLVVITFIDLDHKLILDRLTLPSVPIFYGLGLLLAERQWWHGLVGAVVGYGVVRLIADGYYYLTGREGMGYGDGKLLAVVGALLGWQAVVASLFLGSLLGSVIGVTALVIARRKTRPERAAAGEHAKDAHDAKDAKDAKDAHDAKDTHDDHEDVPLRHVELPFGPFLAMGALVYVYAEPWLEIGVRSALLGGP